MSKDESYYNLMSILIHEEEEESHLEAEVILTNKAILISSSSI